MYEEPTCAEDKEVSYVVYLFSSVDEIESTCMIERVLKEKMSGNSNMQYIVRVEEESDFICNTKTLQA